MKILRVAQKLYPEHKGGGAYHVHAMSRDQAAMGHDVTVLTVSDDESLPRKEERDGYTIFRTRPTIELLGNEISLEVGQFLRAAEDYNIVHAHSHLYFSTNLAAVMRSLGDIPLAITNHGLYSQNAPKWLFYLYLRTSGRWTFNQADLVLCYTDADRDSVRALGVNTRIEVVPNGVDTERFTPDGPTSKLINHDEPVILFVGRLVEGKRPMLALRAFSKLRETYPKAHLYICGEGPLLGELKEECDTLCVDDGVTFLGHVAYDEMPAIYRGADALVLPSRTEGFPRTVIEAMASGVPVVISDLDQVSETIEECGIPVDAGDCFRMSAALEDVISWSTSDFHRRARKLVEDQFRWCDTVEKTTEIFKQIAGDNSNMTKESDV